jgi:type II secretory pathway pseudopilin PulG
MDARSARGYAMVALLVALSVMAVLLSAALPVFQTAARRERETELVFRGQQYARAVGLFQRKNANALPPDLDVLLDQKYLRKKYKDPITGGDFQLLGPGSPELAEVLNSAPQPAGQPGTRGRGGSVVAPLTQQGQGQQQGRGFQSSAFTAGQAPGGIIGVVSKSQQTSLRIYNGREKYSEWVFIPTQMSTAAGAPGDGAQAPGGRGGPAGDGRGGMQPGRGRGRLGQPLDRGRFGGGVRP